MGDSYGASHKLAALSDRFAGFEKQMEVETKHRRDAEEGTKSRFTHVQGTGYSPGRSSREGWESVCFVDFSRGNFCLVLIFALVTRQP